jgi:hypothetical protein
MCCATCKAKGERKRRTARVTQVPSGGRKHIQHNVMVICHEFIKIDSSKLFVEAVKGSRAQSLYFMLEK